MRPVFPRFVTVLALAIALAGLSDRASASTVYYRAAGSAQLDANNDFVGSGRATHLGRYTEVGHVDLAGTSDPAVLSVDGWAHYTAANGDVLRADVVGTLNLSTGAVAATLTYVGGTGRFSDATGSSTLTGQMLGGGALSVVVAGSIDY